MGTCCWNLSSSAQAPAFSSTQAKEASQRKHWPRPRRLLQRSQQLSRLLPKLQPKQQWRKNSRPPRRESSLMKAPCLRMHLRKLKPLAPSLRRLPKPKPSLRRLLSCQLLGRRFGRMCTTRWWNRQKLVTASFAMPGKRQRLKGPSKQNVSFTITFSCLTPMSAKSNATRQAWKGSNRLKSLCLDGWLPSR